MLLLWLLDDLGYCYFDLAGKNGDAAGKNGRRRQKWKRHNDSIISLASTRSSTLFRPVCIAIHAGKSEMLYWVLQLDSNGFYDAGLVVK